MLMIILSKIFYYSLLQEVQEHFYNDFSLIWLKKEHSFRSYET